MCAVRCGDRQRASAASALDLVFGSAFGALISLLSFFPCSKVVTLATLCVRRSNLCRSLLFRLFPITYIRIHSSAPSILHSSIHPTVAHPPMVHWSVHTRSPSPSCSLLLILPFFLLFFFISQPTIFPSYTLLCSRHRTTHRQRPRHSALLLLLPLIGLSAHPHSR